LYDSRNNLNITLKEQHMDSHQQQHSDQQHHQQKTSHARAFVTPFFLILVFAVVELLGGIYTQSLALLGDAWHMFSDVFALGLAWFAAHHSINSKKHASGQSHLEIAASIINAVLMLIVVVYIVIEALNRLKNPHQVTGGYVMLIAFAGLLVNIIVANLLHDDDNDNHNRRAAFLHVMGDLLGSVAALAAGTVIYFSGWLPIDPILSIFISILILLVTSKLIADIWQNLRTKPNNHYPCAD
jgi:cobalt-zinc-cadmium efflux system protein